MPFPFVTLGVAAGSALLNGLFGKDDARDYTIEDLKKYGYQPFNAAEKIAEVMRQAETAKKRVRSQANQKAAQSGLDPVVSSYATTEGIDNALLSAIPEIRRVEAEERNRVAQMLFQANAGERSTFGGRLLGGAILGASIGSQAENAMEGFTDEENPTTEKGKTVSVPKVTPKQENTIIAGEERQDLFGIPGLTMAGDKKGINSWGSGNNWAEPFKTGLGTGLRNLTGQPSSTKELSFMNDPYLFNLRKLFSQSKNQM